MIRNIDIIKLTSKIKRTTKEAAKLMNAVDYDKYLVLCGERDVMKKELRDLKREMKKQN